MSRATRKVALLSALWMICLAGGCGDAPPGGQQTQTTSENERSGDAAVAPEADKAAASGSHAPESAGDAGGPVDPNEPPPIDQTIRTVVEGIAANHPEVVWDAMPVSYQQRIEAIVHMFGKSMDADIYARIIGSLRKIEGILKNKKELILQNPQLAEAGLDSDQLSAHWEEFVALFSTLLDSELSDLHTLQALDVREFLAGTGGTLMTQISQLSSAMPQDPFRTEVVERLSKLEVEVLARNNQAANVLIWLPGEEPSEVRFRQVNNKWVPEDVAGSFATTATQLGMFVNVILPAYLGKNKETVLAQFDALDAALDRVAAAENLDDFNVAVTDAVKQGEAVVTLFSDVDQIVAGLQQEPKRPATREAFVTVIVLDDMDETRRKQLGEQLLALVDDADSSLVVPSSEQGRTSFRVSPVADVEAFIGRLDFADVASIDRQQRTIMIQPRSQQVREPLVAPMPEATPSTE